jgi:serine/threonine protein kinase
MSVVKELIISNNRFEVLDKQIGKGAFGEVYLGMRYKESDEVGIPVAIKKIVKTRLSISECKILLGLGKVSNRSRNIVHVYGVGTSKNHLYVIMELINGEDLSFNIKPDLLGDVLHQMASAVKFIHEYNVVHNDIKPSNFMLTTDNVVKLLDFGLACVVNETVPTTSACTSAPRGTPFYMPPERFMNGTIDNYTAIDVYSLGICFYVMITKERPFYNVPGKDDIKLYWQGKVPHVKYLPKIHDTGVYKHLVLSMTDRDPQKRPTIQEVYDETLRLHVTG